MPSEPYLGDIYAFPFAYAPKGWAMCNGQLLPIAQNQALFAIIGVTYGGNGTTTFALPNLQGRVPIHAGSFGGVGYTLGQAAGEASHTLTISEMPMHTHTLSADAATAATSNSGTPAANRSIGQSVGHPSRGADFTATVYSTAGTTTSLASQAVGTQGSGQGHENMQPYLTLNYCIALVGVFPSRS